MTEVEIEQYFQYHNSNIKSLKIGYDEIRNQIKNHYRSLNKLDQLIYNLPDDDKQKIKSREIETALSRILSGIQVSWAEESIKRLLYEKNLFTDTQRNFLLNTSALDKRWYETLKIVFCIAYDLVPIGDETCRGVNIKMQRRNLGKELVDQYLNLKKIISQHLVPSFSIRNKVQHGEWICAFRPPNSEVYSLEITNNIKKENIITTTSRYTIVNGLYQMIVDLGRFKSNSFALDSIMTPFEYFYERYMRKINFEVGKISSSNLEDFIDDIIQKEIRGIQYRGN